MKAIKSAVKSACNNQPMIFGHVPQDVLDSHYRDIIDALKSGNSERISFMLACLNYLKDRDGYSHIRFAGQQAVMHGWLDVNDNNLFVVKT